MNQFIRLAKPQEVKSPIEKKRAFNSFSEVENYEIVYMPYGFSGRGFYYVSNLRKGLK